MAYLLLNSHDPNRFRPNKLGQIRVEHAFWGKSQALPSDAKLPESVAVTGPLDPDGVPRPHDFMQAFNGAVVSARFKELVESFDTGACFFLPVSAKFGRRDPIRVEGDWYYVIFLKSANPILEDRSTLYWFVAPQRELSPPDRAEEAQLYCHEGSVRELTLWCGQESGHPMPTLPTDLSRPQFIYVSDTFYGAAMAAGITGLERAVKIEELPDDDVHTTASYAPCRANEHYEASNKRFYRLPGYYEIALKEDPLNDWIETCHDQINKLERSGPSDAGWVDLLPDGPLMIETSREYHFRPLIEPQVSMPPFQVVRKTLKDAIEDLQPGKQRFVPVQVYYTDEQGERKLTPGESFITRAPFLELEHVPELAEHLPTSSDLYYPLVEVQWAHMSAKGSVAAIDPEESALHFFRMNGAGGKTFVSEGMSRIMERLARGTELEGQYPFVDLTIDLVRRRSR
ncbi:MAG: hypothetical protein AAGC81_04580 [Pseudomonadota bacterium]